MKENLFEDLALRPGKFRLPAENADMSKWAVIACDQFTSDPGYWEQVASIREGAPSALDLVFPEVYLGQNDDERIAAIRGAMREARADVLTREVDGFVLIERETTDGLRIGLLATVDLDMYASGRVRPTEETVPARVPPRVKIREGATLELAHVLLLADDPDGLLIEKLYAQRDAMPLIYDFDLMLGGGHIRGWQVGEEFYEGIAKALTAFRDRGMGFDIAVGDGNHSLAAACACWKNTGRNRFAMVEVNNLRAPNMIFKPIHRAVFAPLNELPLTGCAVEEADFVLNGTKGYRGNLRDLQAWLDGWCTKNGVKIDYIHGDEALEKLRLAGASTIACRAMDTAALFPAVQGGPLPRKAFSMGEATDKRYYLETAVLE